MDTIKIIDDTDFSVFGTKVFNYFDADNCFFSAQDSGGFGERYISNLSYFQFCKNTELLFWSNEFDYYAITSFDSNKKLIYSNLESNHLINLVFNKSKKHNNLPKIWLPAQISGPQSHYLKQQLHSSNKNIPEIFKNNFVESELSLLSEAGLGDFIPVNLFSKDFDLFITFPGIPPRKIDLRTAKIKYSSACLIIENNIPINNGYIDGLTINSSILSEGSYINYIGLSHLNKPLLKNDKKLNESVNSITLGGFINGEKIDKEKFFVTINKSIFTIHNGDACEPFLIIDLSSNNLSLDGTSEEFIISPDKSSAFRISSDSKDFIQSVFSSHEFQRAANRSSTQGPYIAQNDDNLVRIDKEDQNYVLTTNGANTAILDSNIADRKLLINGNKSKLLIEHYSLQSTMPMLSGIASVLNSLTERSKLIKNKEFQISKLLGIEGQYLTYCVYGGIAKINLYIYQALNVQQLEQIAYSNESKSSFMDIIYSSIPYLINEFEKILFYLPSFVIKNDATFISKIGIGKSIDLTRCENAYTNSLRSNNAFLQHLSKIEGAFARLSSVRRMKTRSDTLSKSAPLGVSVALSVVNPMFLASALQQGLSLFNQKSDVSANESQIFDECFEICMREWSHIVRCLLPVLSAKFAQEIYPTRLALSKVLLETSVKSDPATLDCLQSAVSDRIGKLTSFLEFPCEISEKISRQKCVDFIFEVQKNPEGFESAPF
jgi:hypothetical protein